MGFNSCKDREREGKKGRRGIKGEVGIGYIVCCWWPTMSCHREWSDDCGWQGKKNKEQTKKKLIDNSTLENGYVRAIFLLF